VGGGCTGVSCREAPAGTGASVAIGGSAVPPIEVELP
jgi:hypothetical protein